MEQSSLSEIRTHLEYLGYAIEDHDEMLAASHEVKPNLVVRPLGEGFLISAGFRRNGQGVPPDEADFLDFVNGLNRQAAATRSYTDADGDLLMEAWYPGQYQRHRFAAFMDAWHHDTIEVLGADNELAERFLG